MVRRLDSHWALPKHCKKKHDMVETKTGARARKRTTFTSRVGHDSERVRYTESEAFKLWGGAGGRCSKSNTRLSDCSWLAHQLELQPWLWHAAHGGNKGARAAHSTRLPQFLSEIEFLWVITHRHDTHIFRFSVTYTFWGYIISDVHRE